MSYRGLSYLLCRASCSLSHCLLNCYRTLKTEHRLSILLKLHQAPSLHYGQASGLLVPVSCTPLSASTPGLSTSFSSRGLQPKLRMSHLKDGFTLRCLQRLSAPGLATLPWGWSPTGTPAARPPRSSRTKGGSPQTSCARAG